MDIVIRILMGLEFIICILLIGIVLIQRSKGQGVGLSFGGGAEAIFGAQMGNVLTRTTVVLGVLFVVNTTLLAVLKPTRSTKSAAERFAPVASQQTPAAGQEAVAPAPIDILPSDILPSVEEVDAAADTAAVVVDSAEAPIAVEPVETTTVEAVEAAGAEAVEATEEEVPVGNEAVAPVGAVEDAAATSAE